jgi:hypothetical protein
MGKRPPFPVLMILCAFMFVGQQLVKSFAGILEIQSVCSHCGVDLFKPLDDV